MSPIIHFLDDRARAVEVDSLVPYCPLTNTNNRLPQHPAHRHTQPTLPIRKILHQSINLIQPRRTQPRESHRRPNPNNDDTTGFNQAEALYNLWVYCTLSPGPRCE